QCGDQPGHLAPRQRAQPDLLHLHRATHLGQPPGHVPGQRCLIPAAGHHHTHRTAAAAADYKRQAIQRRTVRPVHILNHHPHPTPPARGAPRAPTGPPPAKNSRPRPPPSPPLPPGSGPPLGARPGTSRATSSRTYSGTAPSAAATSSPSPTRASSPSTPATG